MSKPLQGIVKIVDFDDLEGFGYINYIFRPTYPYVYTLFQLTILTIPCNGLELKTITIKTNDNSL